MMAPPRQRTATALDDSRSEASSSTKERQGTVPKGRRPANPPAATGAMLSKEMKLAAATVPANPDAEQSGTLSGIPWSTMPLSFLHEYRHAYNLASPSAYSSQISSIVLSQGIGLRSPTAIAARRAQSAARSHHKSNGVSQSSKRVKESAGASRRETSTNAGSAVNRRDNVEKRKDVGLELHQLRGRGRVSRDQLAMSVRKHFNNVALVEQEAIARFLYKVREEGKGREFRLRFKP